METKENWFFVRGLIRESSHWHDFPERFASAFPHRRVHLLDLLGNGRHFREESPISISRFAKALREDFLKSGGKEKGKNYIFALSLGAMVAVEWLHQYPKDISGAVLLNTSLRNVSSFYERLRPGNYPAILRLLLTNKLLDRERAILRMTSNLHSADENIVREWETIQKERPVTKANALRQILAALRYLPPLSKPEAPLLILNGAKDRLVNPVCSERLAALWGCEIRTHPEAGHDLPLDAPEWVIECLKAWPRSE